MKAVEILPLAHCRRIHTAPKSPRTPRSGLHTRDTTRAWHSSHGRGLTSAAASRDVRTPKCPDTDEKIERYIPRYYDIIKREGNLKSNCFDLDLDPEGEDLKTLNTFRRYPAGKKLLLREFSKPSSCVETPDPVGLGMGLSYDMAERYYLVKLFKDPLNIEVLMKYAGWLEEVERLEDAEKMY